VVDSGAASQIPEVDLPHRVGAIFLPPWPARKWDWVALLIDTDPDEFRRGRNARDCVVRIPGKHRNREDAYEVLDAMMATKH
jgi:hypothetical protein